MCPKFSALVLLACGLPATGQTPVGPVIGVLTQDAGEDLGASATHRTYVAASYIKYLEAAGARVVPVHYEAPLTELTTLFGQINGLLFPGGGADLTDMKGTYMVAVQHLWGLMAKANAAGDFFPVWGTCLGFQTLAIAGAGFNASVLEGPFDSENLPLPLTFTAAAESSALFGSGGSVPAAVLSMLKSENITMNNHRSGVTPLTFGTNTALSQFYNILSTNNDRMGKAFVSTIEGKTLPVYASQWHPEKNIFEWTAREQIPHTVAAVTIAQYTANFFVQQARKSKHTIDYDALNKIIIYNFNPEFTYLQGSNFEQSYFWPYAAAK